MQTYYRPTDFKSVNEGERGSAWDVGYGQIPVT